MPGDMSMFRIVFHLYFLSVCSVTLIAAVKMKLYPSDITVTTGDWATITCKVPCELELNRSHTFKWFVGDHRIRKVESQADFEKRTGIKVEPLPPPPSSCTAGPSKFAYHKLKVFASSAERINRTAVQCAALRKGPAFTDYYSYFAVILVKDEPQITTEPPTQQAVHTKYDHSKESEVESLESHISPTQCITVKETVTVTVTPTIVLGTS